MNSQDGIGSIHQIIFERDRVPAVKFLQVTQGNSYEIALVQILELHVSTFRPYICIRGINSHSTAFEFMKSATLRMSLNIDNGFFVTSAT